MDIIKILNGCIFIGKVDDVLVVVGAQNSPIYVVLNWMIPFFFSVLHTREPGPI